MPRIPRKRPVDYILPFLIMICAGVIVVLGYQLWTTMNSPDEEKDIYMYVAQGNAKILPWGAGEWEKAYSGTRLLQGDSIKTQSGGKMVVELFKDHYVRLDEKTEVVLSEIKENNGVYEISILLNDGKIWLNSNEDSETPVKFTTRTNHTVVNTLSTIYEIEQMPFEEAFRVIKGDIIVDVLVDEDGKKNKVESLNIGVGQQAVITDADMEKYKQRENPSVISALSDIFRDSSFYKWNMSEDNNPTDFSTKTGPIDMTMFETGATEDVTEDLDLSDLVSPVITVPSTLNFTTNESSLSIRGTTPTETKKMMVDIKVSGASAAQPNELNLYIPGNTEWSFAVSEATDNLKKGTNTYSFYSVDENGKNSKKTVLTVVYGTPDDVPAEEDTPADETTPEEEEDLSNLNLGALSAPVVTLYNGSDSSEVDVDSVKVEGTVAGAAKVTVSGYQLKSFSPGDTSWVYYAKESLGNMDPGVNTFTVVAEGPDGTQKSTSFSITYNKAETAEEPVSDQPATGDAM